MAERRMFAKTIIDSDAFLEMPLSAQALYFHLGMRADDDGFVNSPKKIMRTVACSEDDMKLLIAKKFIIPFESGIVVIKHWRIHNYIQKDRYHETNYTEEKAMLTTKENGAYSLMDTPCIQDVSKVDTEVSIGKDSQGEVSQGKERANISALKAEFEEIWKLYPRKHGKDKAREYYIRDRKAGATYEEIGKGVLDYANYVQAENIELQYMKMGSTFFSQKSWMDDWQIRSKSKSNNPFMDMLMNGDY